MKNCLDTSAWIKVFHNGANSHHFSPLVIKSENLIVSTMTLYGVWKYCLRTVGPETGNSLISALKPGNVIFIDEKISHLAASISHEKRISMGEAPIYATASLSDAILRTQDDHFKDLPHVRYFPKIKIKKLQG